MSRPRYRVQPAHAQDGRFAGWNVLLKSRDGLPLGMAASFTGSFAWWRARRRASALNRKGWQ